MELSEDTTRLTRRVIDALYVEAMVLADEARHYFDEFSHADRALLLPVQRVGFSCESLKVTTRLMHVIAWLLSRRAGEGDLARVPARLGRAAGSMAEMIELLPEAAQALIRSSEELYDRIARLDAQQTLEAPSPALLLQRQLQSAF